MADMVTHPKVQFPELFPDNSFPRFGRCHIHRFKNLFSLALYGELERGIYGVEGRHRYNSMWKSFEFQNCCGMRIICLLVQESQGIART
jgi:hypothetical protein